LVITRRLLAPGRGWVWIRAVRNVIGFSQVGRRAAVTDVADDAPRPTSLQHFVRQCTVLGPARRGLIA